jgi:methylphosphotriester-DNA--protein-cysteine methyltransferase
MSAFLKQKLWQKPGLTNTPVVGVTIVKPVEPSVTLRALLSRLASELGVSEDYLSLGLRTSLGTDPKQFARIARAEKVSQAMGEISASERSLTAIGASRRSDHAKPARRDSAAA